MRTIGNILWFLFGGLINGLLWWITGALRCVTIIGIPVGIQCFKLSGVSFWPFGKEVVYTGGAFSFIVNVIWFFFGGLALAATHFFFGLLWCITIVGIPFGKQFFKLAKLSLAPVGAEVYVKTN